MKLYTEEQVIELCMFFGSYHNYSIEETKQIIEEEQTPIELPSDEEIRNLAKELCKGHQHAMRYNSMLVACFEMGKKMKEQILNQNK